MLNTPGAVVFGMVYDFLPFMILPIYNSMARIKKDIIDAAKDLGAGAIRTFWYITLPLTAPGIMAGCILVFLPALGIFYVPEILGGATNLLLGTFIKNQFLVANDWPLGAAASSVMTIMLGFLALAYKFVGRKTGSSMGESLIGTPMSQGGKD